MTTPEDVIKTLLPMAGIMRDTQPQFQEFQEHEQTPVTMLSSAEISDNDRARVMASLGASPVGIDDLTRECQINPAQLHTIIIEMELAGRLTRHSNHTVSIK